MKSIKVINHSTNALPAYQTEGASGMDLCAFLKEPLEMKPLERVLVPTGLYIEIPTGCEVQIRARSGLSIKHGVTMINGIGTIDADYRGEIKIPLINLSDKSYTIQNGERVAQMVLMAVEKIDWLETDEIEATERGQGGFGHTGRE